MRKTSVLQSSTCGQFGEEPGIYRSYSACVEIAYELEAGVGDGGNSNCPMEAVEETVTGCARCYCGLLAPNPPFLPHRSRDSANSIPPLLVGQRGSLEGTICLRLACAPAAFPTMEAGRRHLWRRSDKLCNPFLSF